MILNMVILLARDGDPSDGQCEFLGFLYTFSFNFAVIEILIAVLEKIHNLLTPFEYHKYTHGESYVPVIIFICCALYGLLLAILPLTNLGNYYQSKYSICLIHWDEERATRVTVVFNVLAFSVIIACIGFYLRLIWKLFAERKRLKVNLYRHKETVVFTLVASSSFLVCWFPNMVRIGHKLCYKVVWSVMHA